MKRYARFLFKSYKKMRFIIVFSMSCILVCTTRTTNLSKLCQLVKANREVVGKQPFRVKTTGSVIQCLLELVTLLSCFIEIEKTDAGNYLCKMYPGNIENYKTIPNTKSNIYKPAIPQLCQDQSPSNKKWSL